MSQPIEVAQNEMRELIAAQAPMPSDLQDMYDLQSGKRLPRWSSTDEGLEWLAQLSDQNTEAESQSEHVPFEYEKYEDYKSQRGVWVFDGLTWFLSRPRRQISLAKAGAFWLSATAVVSNIENGFSDDTPGHIAARAAVSVGIPTLWYAAVNKVEQRQAARRTARSMGVEVES